MIRYALACPEAHEFESWFRDSAAFDAQVAGGLVACPFCGSSKVEKQIMAPSVARSDRRPDPARPAAPPAQGELPARGEPPAPRAPAPTAAEPQPAAAAAQAMALLSERDRELRAMIKAVREHVTRNAEYVGPRFADEARKMHYGDIEHRSIYGEADAAEARALVEEGVEVHPLPSAPDDRN
jgi:hypothetical protein